MSAYTPAFNNKDYTVSKRKNRLNRKPVQSITGRSTKPAESSKFITIKTSDNGTSKVPVSRKVTELEMAIVKLNQAREKLISLQRVVNRLKREKAEVESRADELEIQLAVKSNEDFRRENNLKLGDQIFQDAETSEYYWGAGEAAKENADSDDEDEDEAAEDDQEDMDGKGATDSGTVEKIPLDEVDEDNASEELESRPAATAAL